ncbi:MAG: MBL fold metallo-hydrolase [Chloroflexi bacterium]|nr:MBL fold metallo-hydrolase [Chloroflexota bacterium]
MAAIEEIFPHIYAVPLGYVNAFMLEEENGLTLIDAGLRGNERKLWKAVREIGRKPSDVHHVLVTHHHADHVGSLAAVKKASGAEAYVHPLDAPVVAGEKPRPAANRASIIGRLLGRMILRLPANKPTPVPADHEINDGDELAIGGGVRVIHTPGHTAGHVSFFVERHGGVLFVGDAAANMMGRFGKPLLMFTEDMDEVGKSMRKLAALEFDTACFGHGRVLKGKANLAFRRYVEKMAQ